MAPATTTSPTEPAEQVRGRGRPRDEGIDERVCRATLELLAEQGYAATTMTAVARRAGVGTAALYRRWSTVTELVEHAIFPGFPDLVLAPTGDLRDDVQRYVDAYCGMFATPAARAAMPGLISGYQSDPGMPRRIGDSIAGSRVRDAFRALVEHDLAATGADPAMDPDDALDVLIGAVMQHCFVRPFFGRAADNRYVTDAVVRAVQA
jgi:AcrR family transcriptional regulator